MQNILFDLDGTLIDHFSAIHRGVAYAQQKLGLPESDYATVRATVGGSVPITLGKLCGEEHVEAAIPYFRDHFAEIMYDDVEIIPGSDWLLKALKTNGHKLGVFTNKYETHAAAILEHLGLAQYLDVIVGTGHGHGHRKPDPRFTMEALERMACASDEAAMVGDSPYDFAAAQAGCLPCYLLATGSHTAEQLADATGSSTIFNDLRELGERVFSIT
ncbi:HAD family hydrolase [Coraliomargarita sinensis]|nr:HAD family hydrolase [Coraliomargarita sinensis]